MLPGSEGTPQYIIATGIDITEREQLERALLNISAREQRRIGQDLHDGLGQHLTGIAFMAKVHEAKLAEKRAWPMPPTQPRSCGWSTKRSTRRASWRAACFRWCPTRRA